MKNNLITFVKGFLMGIVEVVPGISGSTIALFLGIYAKLITSFHNLIPSKSFFNNSKIFLLSSFAKKKQTLQKLNIDFLFYLILGMFFAILIFSHIISFFLENYKSYLLSFFLGLIISLFFIQGFKFISKKKYLKENFLGFIFGLSFFLLEPSKILGENPLSIIMLGIIVIFFGLLPGISGSFILLIMGKYEFMIQGLKNFDITFLFFYSIGTAIGILIFIKPIHLLMKYHKKKIFAFFYSFILGSSSVLVKMILENITNIFGIILFFTLGILVIITSKYLSQIL